MGKRVAKWPHRTAKRHEAEKRQAARATRSIDEQLQLIARRPGASKRETTRLRKLKDATNVTKNTDKGVHMGSEESKARPSAPVQHDEGRGRKGSRNKP